MTIADPNRAATEPDPPRPASHIAQDLQQGLYQLEQIMDLVEGWITDQPSDPLGEVEQMGSVLAAARHMARSMDATTGDLVERLIVAERKSGERHDA